MSPQVKLCGGLFRRELQYSGAVNYAPPELDGDMDAALVNMDGVHIGMGLVLPPVRDRGNRDARHGGQILPPAESGEKDSLDLRAPFLSARGPNLIGN